MTFSYSYSSKCAKEVQEIRSKYLPREENKLEELKRLDRRVQDAGMLEGLIAGLAGALVFGLGFCMVMKVIGGGVILGALLAVIALVPVAAAYPIYRKVSRKTREKLTPRILQLADEIEGKKIQINISETKDNQNQNIG